MALLQISEPGGAPAKSAHRLAVGIDLGTTNSLVAASCGGKIEILPDEDGRYLLPSVVHVGSKGEITVGERAKQFGIEDPENTLVSVKRWFGKNLAEVQALPNSSHYTFDQDRDERAPAALTVAGTMDPVRVSAEILSALVERAEFCLKGKLEGAVITVPAYFNDAQRQQTKDAAEIAGLKALRLLNEPTAAAVAYGLDSNDQGNVVVFDLGGGTFDVSLLSLRQGVFEVLATGGDTNLGGDDFDQALVKYLEERIAGNAAELSMVKPGVLRRTAIDLKHGLTEAGQVDVEFENYSAKLTRDDFAEICEDLVKRTIMTCRRVLRDAGMEVTQIDNVVLVGGATRMPVIREAVADFFGKPPLTDINPDKAVAIGAGIQADVLIGNKSANDFLLLDVNPLSLGIETMGELVEKIIPRNSTIPVAKAQEFTTFKDGQTAMSLHVVQGERELVSDCRSLARFDLRGIPPMVAGAAKVRVTFQVDADGLLSVIAEELSTGKKAEIQVKPSYGLDSSAIEEMLQASHDNAVSDRDTRALREAQLDGQQILDAIDAALQEDGALLTSIERSAIEDVMAELSAAMDSAVVVEIHELVEKLNRVSSEFAARRMDLHIGALRGESIETVETGSG